MTEPMRWRVVAYMAALFIAGVVTGAAVVAHLSASSQTLKVGRAEEIGQIIRQRLGPLELTHEQREKFAPLIKKTSEQLEASHLECLKQCAAAVDSLHAQMQPDLTPEQVEKMKQLEAERSATMRQKYNYPPESSQAGNH